MPDTIPAITGIAYKVLSREDPKKTHRCGLRWSLPELSKIDPLWACCVKFSTNHKILILLLNLVLVLLALLMNRVLLL